METETTVEVECKLPNFDSPINISMPNGEAEARKYIKNQKEAFPDSGIVYKLVIITITKEAI
jgi:hypothetical protein